MAELEFKSLEDEVYRTYVFPDGSQVTIEYPRSLNVSASGGHRILDDKGIAHYIPFKWVHLYWKVRDGKAPFAF